MKRCLSSPLAVGRVKMIKFAAETSNIIVAFVFAFVFVFVFVFILWLQCPSPVMTLRQGLGQGEIPSIPFLETGDELLVSQMIPRQTFLLNQIFVASIFPLLIKLSLHTIE